MSNSSSSNPIILTPGGQREVVDLEKAMDIISQWKPILDQQQQSTTASTTTPNIYKIDLSDKSWTIEAAQQIANFLTSTEIYNPPLATFIQIANLNDIIASRMEEEGLQVLKTLSDVFECSTNLIEVDLSDNAMGSKGVSQCHAVLSSKCRGGNITLERLSLCNNGLSEYSMNEIADLLTEEACLNNEGQDDDDEKKNTMMCIAENLTKIHFFNNMSGNEGCKAFERIMNKCSSKLTDIRFSSTRARREGSEYIAKALMTLANDGRLHNVTQLDLCDNSFAECYTTLADALSTCLNLEYLNLKDCILASEGVEAVCNALIKANPPLKVIHLSGNEIDADGAKFVAKIVKKFNASIEILNVEENEMTSIGIKRIVKNLNAPRLTKLILSENECGRIGVNALIECVDKIPSLESIELDRNNFSDEMVDELKEAFGDKLEEMEDIFGEEEEDDEDDDEDEEDEEEEDEPEESAEEISKDTADIDDLAGAMSNIGI